MTRTPTEMELRVERVLSEYDLNDVLPRELLPELARAAIRAMREPTDTMFEAGLWFGDAHETWAAMIDAASPPDSK